MGCGWPGGCRRPTRRPGRRSRPGLLRVEQVRVIVKAAERAPAGVTGEQLHAAEAELVAKATGVGSRTGRPMNAKRLRQAARRMFETVSVELADRHESDQLNAEADRAEAETWCTLHDNGDGTFAGRFVIPELHGTVLKTALDRLTAPRHHTTAADGGAEGARGGSAGDRSDPDQHPELVRTARDGAGRADRAPAHSAGSAPRNTAGVLVTLGYDALVSGIGAAGLDTGVRISARDARRLACNAAIIPAVLGGQSQPLDLGRTRRLHSSCPTQGAGIDPRLVCDRHLRPAVRVDRDPPPPPLVPGRQNRPGQRPPTLRAPPPPSPRHPLRPPPPQPRRLALPPTQIDAADRYGRRASRTRAPTLV